MTHFLTVIVLDLTSVTWCPIQTTLVFLLSKRFIGMSWVNYGGRGGVFSTFLVPSTSFHLLFFPSFVGKLVVIRALGGTWRWFYILDLRFFCPRVFHGNTLALGNGGVGWSAASGTVLIHLFSTGVRLKSQLSLGVNGLLDHLIKAFQLKVSIFLLSQNRRL